MQKKTPDRGSGRHKSSSVTIISRFQNHRHNRHDRHGSHTNQLLNSIIQAVIVCYTDIGIKTASIAFGSQRQHVGKTQTP